MKFVPNREFLVDWVKGKGERRLTYKQTAEDVYRLCWAPKDLGVKKGDMVALIGFNSVEGCEMVLSSFFGGWAYGCQNPMLPERLAHHDSKRQNGCQVSFLR